MIRNLRLYLRLIGVQVRSQAQYRLSFVLDLVQTALGSMMGFLSLVLVLQRFRRAHDNVAQPVAVPVVLAVRRVALYGAGEAVP